MLGMYDFVGIAERFNETMVLLKHILGLEWKDVIYLPSKISGQQTNKEHTPIKAYKPFEEEEQSLKDFVAAKWKKFSMNKDFYIHERVTEKFESLIASIPTFQDDLEKFEMALDVALSICGWLTYEPGLLKRNLKAYAKDNGIGHECIDHIGSGFERFFENPNRMIYSKSMKNL